MEVVVAPRLEASMIGHLVCITDRFVGGMEMGRVFLEEVTRGQVCTAAKPPGARFLTVASFEIAVVGMNGWGHWVPRVEHQTQACGEEVQVFVVVQSLPSAHGPCGFWPQGSVHDADVDTGLLEHLSFAEHPAAASSSAFSRPHVLTWGAAIDGLQSVTDAVLFAVNKIDHALAHHRPSTVRRTASTHSMRALGAKPCPRLKM